jgi:hypothetical protein
MVDQMVVVLEMKVVLKKVPKMVEMKAVLMDQLLDDLKVALWVVSMVGTMVVYLDVS